MNRRWWMLVATALLGACTGTNDSIPGLDENDAGDSSSAGDSLLTDVAADDALLDSGPDASADDSGEGNDTQPLSDAESNTDANDSDDGSAGSDGADDVADASDAGDGSGGLDAADDVADASDAGDGSGGSDATSDADVTPPDEVVVSYDFEVELPGFIDGSACGLTPSQGYAPLGPEGNQFGATFIRCQTAQAVLVNLTDLPAHTSVSVDFLFAAIDSLDGAGSFPAGDFFRIDVDGVAVFRESFANAVESQIQTYAPPVPEIVLARRVDLGFTVGGFYLDSAYDMSLEPRFDRIPHSGPTLSLTFLLEGEGVQSLDDESWAIDNLRITLHND